MKLFRFPTDPCRRDAWIRAIKRKNWMPSEYSMVCQLHFISKRPSRFPNNPDYVPSIFSFSRSTVASQRDNVDRYERLQARRKRQSQLAECEEDDSDVPEDDSNVPETQPQRPGNITDFCLEGPNLHVESTPSTSGELSLLVQPPELIQLKEKLLHTEENLKKANEKVASLEERVKADEEVIEATEKKLREAEDRLRRSDEEKVLLMRQLHRNSSIALKVKNDDNQTHLFTGLPSYDVFALLLSHLSPLTAEEKSLGSGLTLADELLVTLMKISQAFTNQVIGSIFEVHETKVSRIFHRWVDVMFQGLQPLVVWPDKEMIVTHLPSCFKPHYSKAVCIIDCTEVFIQRPTSLTARAQTFSNYKGHNTVKFLVAITPTGAVSFISKCWGGRVSDRHLTINSGLLRHLKYGDLVLADRGFDIADDLAMIGASLAIPPFTKGKPQLSQREVEFSRQLSSIRIHVERAIGRMKNFKILQSNLPISLIKRDCETEFATIDKIVFICAALSNLYPPLVT